MILTYFTKVNSFRKYISFLLLLASTLFIVPKEYLHELQHHTDTVDVPVHTSETTVGSIHHHCDVLQLFVEPFDNFKQDLFFANFLLFENAAVFILPHFDTQVNKAFSIRGPPLS